MSIEIVTYYLKRHAPLVAITTPARIYPLMAPQTVVSPYIVLHEINSSDAAKLDGQNRYDVARIQVDCNSQSATEAKRMGDLVREALLDIIKAKAIGCVDIDVIFVMAHTDYDDARTMCRRLLQFSVRWKNGP